MGWTSYQIYESPKKELDKMYIGDLIDYKTKEVVGHSEIVHSVLRGSVYYASVRQTFTDGRPETVSAAVCLVQYSPKAHHDNFAYKDMDETMGPFKYDCPENILNDLTPTENEYALQWRAECRKRIARNKKLTSVKVGQYITYVNTYDLQSCSEGDTVFVKKTGKRNRFMHNGHIMPIKYIADEVEVIDSDEYEKRIKVLREQRRQQMLAEWRKENGMEV